jgi:hypothetical protein
MWKCCRYIPRKDQDTATAAQQSSLWRRLAGHGRGKQGHLHARETERMEKSKNLEHCYLGSLDDPGRPLRETLMVSYICLLGVPPGGP